LAPPCASQIDRCVECSQAEVVGENGAVLASQLNHRLNVQKQAVILIPRGT